MSTDTQERDYCPICKREGEIEEAPYTCDICDKPMCYMHRNHSDGYEQAGGECSYCDDCTLEY